MSQSESDDADARLEQLRSQIHQANRESRNRTALRLSSEARRIAKIERRLCPYLRALYDYSDCVGDEHAPRESIEASIELIALLEDADRARAFQSDFPEEEYESCRQWMLTRAYKNLASATAHRYGYNSPGMHQCITDGIEVCRRMGDRFGLILFREFAVEVYRSADDIDMALHFARESLNMQGNDEVGRRVASADDVASLLAMQGNLAAAVDAVQFGWPLCAEFFNPYCAHLNYVPMSRQILSLAGRTDLLAQFPKVVDAGEQVPDGVTPIPLPPREESSQFAYIYDRSMFVEECCRGDFEAAINRLKPWDRKFRELECLSDWFEIRLRLIGAYRCLEKWDQLEPLARPLREAARTAHDWLTLRRLERVLDPSIPATPVPLLGEVTIGPFAVRRDEATAQPAPVALGSGEGLEADAPDSAEESGAPWGERVQALYMRLTEGPDQRAEIVGELIEIEPSSLSDSEEAGVLLHLVRFASHRDERLVAIWDWANAVHQQFSQAPTVLSMLAALGHAFRKSLTQEELDDAGEPLPPPALPAGIELDALIPLERIESLHRQALDLDPQNAENYARAGSFHFDQERFGDAERCLARSFRLNRTLSAAALRLAEVYARTERPQDSLAVLDLAIREGCEDPQLAWRAGLAAYSLEQYPAMLTYFDRFEELAPNEPWVQHHRACALLELGRPDEALEAIEREQALNPEAAAANQMQRVAAYGQLRREAEFRTGLETILATRLGSIETLTIQGIARLMEQVWKSSPLPADDSLQRALEDRLLGCGIAPSELLVQIRKRSGRPEKVRLFQCILHQPLDDSWSTSHQCTPGEEGWTGYDTAWNVLARDAEHATELALQIQSRCWGTSARVIDVLESDNEYEEFPGVVWQGGRAAGQSGEESPPAG
jgi:tetratricopeptide (TPR) repeat protein